jgi:hypothetical protein
MEKTKRSDIGRNIHAVKQTSRRLKTQNAAIHPSVHSAKKELPRAGGGLTKLVQTKKSSSKHLGR